MGVPGLGVVDALGFSLIEGVLRDELSLWGLRLLALRLVVSVVSFFLRLLELALEASVWPLVGVAEGLGWGRVSPVVPLVPLVSWGDLAVPLCDDVLLVSLFMSSTTSSLSLFSPSDESSLLLRHVAELLLACCCC